LFGSGAREKNFNTASDLDFIFKFKSDDKGLPKGGYDYFDLMFKLQEITERAIDLVAEEKIVNRYFLEEVNKEKICLYEG
jgi:predicted nucleotidyltransferase